MSDKGVQVDWNDDSFLDIDECYEKVQQLRNELIQARAEAARLGTTLTDACAARDALARECGQLEADCEYNASLVMRKERDLAQLQRRLATTVQRCGYCGYKATGADAFNLVAEHIKTCPSHPLAKALVELKDLQGANREYGRQLADVTANREFWYKEAQDAEAGREHWLKAHDRVQRQSAQVEAQRDRCLRDYDKLEKRLATLDAAEAAVEGCGLTGIYDDFSSPADAIKQMVERIVQLEGGQALQNERTLRQVAEMSERAMRRLLDGERQLQQEAEKYVDDCRIVLTGVRKALDECQVEGKYDASAVMRIRWLAQRAERAETLAQLVNEETAELLERLAEWARRAQGYVVGHWTTEDDQIGVDSEIARALAAQIREALAQETNDES
jgi:chromosome segregation ATPase